MQKEVISLNSVPLTRAFFSKRNSEIPNNSEHCIWCDGEFHSLQYLSSERVANHILIMITHPCHYLGLRLSYLNI